MSKISILKLIFILALLPHTGCASFKSAQSLSATSLEPIVESPVSIDPYRLVISVNDQRMTLSKGSAIVARYLISTAEKGVGEVVDSERTPRGRHAIVEKVGAGAPIGTVFKDRLATGEIVSVNAPNNSSIITRILRLRGLEDKNQTTFIRYIYLQGTPAENLLGTPASGGNIRMRSEEIVDLFERVNVDTEVWILEESMEAALNLVALNDVHFAELKANAEKGDANAVFQMCVGHMYGTRGLPLNDAAALAWCSRAADKDNPNAITLLGQLHEYGRAVTVDLVAARQFYERAAKLGHPHAQFKVALMYQSGIGGAADAAMAAQYLELSVKQGYERAIRHLSTKAQ